MVDDKVKAKKENKGIGLALSGGGYRAGLYHLGSLWRLNELGWLPKIDEYTSVSGGSIVAAYLAMRWDELDFDGVGTASNFQDIIIEPLRVMFATGIDIKAGFIGVFNPFTSAAEQLIKTYDKLLFKGKTLQDIPGERPRFTLYATGLQTAVSLRFAQPYMADYRIGKIDIPDISLATVVAASSGFPPVFCPVKLKFKSSDWSYFKQNDGGKPELFDNDDIKEELQLGDGGIYDNLGLERIWNSKATVLVSDAGGKFGVKPTLGFDYLRRALRVVDIMTEQTRALRKRKLIDDFTQKIRGGAYWGIATEIENYQLDQNGKAPALLSDNLKTASMKDIRTRLNHFKADEQEQLIDWCYALTDAAMRRYVLDDDDRGKLPYPDRFDE